MWVDSTSRTSRSYVSAADWVFLPKFNRRIVVAPPQNHHHHNVHSSRVGMPLPPQVMAKKQSAKSPWMCVTVLCFSSILMIPRHHPNIKAYTILSHTNIIIILKNNLLIFGYIFYVQVQYYRSSTVLSVITFCVFFSLLLPRCWSIVLLHSRLVPVFVSLFLRVFPSVVVLCGVH